MNTHFPVTYPQTSYLDVSLIYKSYGAYYWLDFEWLPRKMQRQGERPTVSRTPGTTLGLIQLRAFRRSATSPVFASLYDTPGATRINGWPLKCQSLDIFFIYKLGLSWIVLASVRSSFSDLPDDSWNMRTYEIYPNLKYYMTCNLWPHQVRMIKTPRFHSPKGI